VDIDGRIPVLHPIFEFDQEDPEKAASSKYNSAYHDWMVEHDKGSLLISSKAPELAIDAFAAGVEFMAIRLAKIAQANRATNTDSSNSALEL
jgi:hypothetical protein